MHFRILFIAVVLTIVSFSLPDLVQAKIPFFGPIIPASSPTCALGWGAVIVVVNNIIEFLLTIAIVFVAPIMIAYSGFLFVVNPVNPAGKEKAKGMLLNTIVGIVIALSAWLIVGAVMAALYHPDPSQGFVENWYNIINSGGQSACLDQSGTVSSPPTGTSPTPPAGVAVAPTPPPTGGVLQCTVSNTNNIKTLGAAGILVSSSGNCCDQNKRECTSLDGMREATIAQVIEIQRVCGGVKVTGGTEVGHSNIGGFNHSSGYKIDLAPNIDGCIDKSPRTSTAGTRSDGAALRKDSCGNIYARESNHWDITVLGVCPLMK